MPDIGLTSPSGVLDWDVSFTDDVTSPSDVARDVVLDLGLATSIYVSLFTDGRADFGDLGDRRGWWADEFEPIGSLLWTLIREKVTPEVLDRAKVYTENALQWLLDDGVASKVDVQVARTGLFSISIAVTISRPDARDENFRYAVNWENN